MIEKPRPNEYDPFYAGYVARVEEEHDVLDLLERQLRRIESLPSEVDPSQETYRYAEGKWSIRQLVGHLGDAERVFGYRAMCISRGDQSPLPGFDENEYVGASSSDGRTLQSLVEELAALRRSNIVLFRDLPPGSAGKVGNANGSPVSVRALAWIIAGHCWHHLSVLEERYGVRRSDE